MDCIIWGGTGQAKVVHPILRADGHDVVALFDNDPTRESPLPDTPLLGGWDAFGEYRSTLTGRCGFVVAIGGPRGVARCEISDKLTQAGLEALTVVHERAYVAVEATIGRGCQIHAMCSVCVWAQLDEFCIVNTMANVDHDCRVGRGAHVSVGAMIGGEAKIGEYAMIGINATVLPRVEIGAHAMVGAGAVVTRNVEPGATVAGVPARVLSRRTSQS